MSAWLGRLLRGVNAGEHKLLWNAEEMKATGADLSLTSSAFENGSPLPLRFAGKGVGQNLSPPLQWSAVPAQTRELVLVMEDPDAPLPRPFVHLLLLGIAPTCHGMPEGTLSGRLCANTFRKRTYVGPRALKGHGPHRYVFQLFALSCELDASRVHNLRHLRQFAAGNVLARGRLDVVFERN